MNYYQEINSLDFPMSVILILIGMPQQQQLVQPTPQMPAILQSHSLLEESLIFSKLLKNGLKCFMVYSKAPPPYKQDTEKV
jgi:hypothetical protein